MHHGDTVSGEDQIMRTLGRYLLSRYHDTRVTLPRVAVSVFLMKCLQKTRFWGEAATSADEALAVAAVLHRLLSACPANTHEVHQLATPTLDR